MFHLNKSGAYYNMKEQLKASVVQVVRERFRKKSPFTTKSDLQLFMSEVYVYLMDELHLILSEIYKGQANEFEGADFEALKLFADEAEWSRQPLSAAKYHQQRIAKYEENLQAWFDYSSFCLRNKKIPLGEEGIQEIFSRNTNYVPALLAHGMLCLANEKYDEAKVFLEKSLQAEADNIVANGLMVALLF